MQCTPLGIRKHTVYLVASDLGPVKTCAHLEEQTQDKAFLHGLKTDFCGLDDNVHAGKKAWRKDNLSSMINYSSSYDED